VPRNKLIDLNNILFEQLERLNDEDLNEKELNKELERTKAIVEIGKTIISNAQTAINAQKVVNDYDIKKKDKMLEITMGD
jgi:hypothetical protein